MQSATWARFKSRFGWGARAFLVEWAAGTREPLNKAAESAVPADFQSDAFAPYGAQMRLSSPLLVLSRKIAPGIRMAYVPWGPELPVGFPGEPDLRNKALAELARALRPLLPRNTTFVRFDPPWFDPEGSISRTLPPPFSRAAADIQPPDTVIVDLTPPDRDILASMKPKWRYNIGLAEKRGVTVSAATDMERDLRVFYGLLTETAERDGIAVHSIEYYRSLFEECGGDSGGLVPTKLCLYTAHHENECLAAIVVLCRGDQATYLYGASSNAKRNLMAPYALQWRAMLDAKAAGCARYDLFGIPPDDNPSHPMAGLYRFKTGFGGKILHRPGSWDYPCRPIPYALFSAAERLRKKLRDRRKS